MRQIKYTRILLIVLNMISFSKCSLLSKWKFGYESIFLPWGDYNRELSECVTDQDCEELYKEEFQYPADSVNVTSLLSFNDYYEGLYELAEPWGGSPHWTNYDRSRHIYYVILKNNSKGWCFNDYE